MNVSTLIPPTIHFPRGRVLGVIAVVVALAAADPTVLLVYPDLRPQGDDFARRVSAACQAPYKVTDWMIGNDHGQTLDSYVTVTCRKLGKYNITLDEYEALVKR